MDPLRGLTPILVVSLANGCGGRSALTVRRTPSDQVRVTTAMVREGREDSMVGRGPSRSRSLPRLSRRCIGVPHQILTRNPCVPLGRRLVRELSQRLRARASASPLRRSTINAGAFLRRLRLRKINLGAARPPSRPRAARDGANPPPSHHLRSRLVAGHTDAKE